MPQMAPLWWVLLLILFISAILLMIIKLNFFNINKMTLEKSNKHIKTNNQLKWTW